MEKLNYIKTIKTKDFDLKLKIYKNKIVLVKDYPSEFFEEDGKTLIAWTKETFVLKSDEIKFISTFKKSDAFEVLGCFSDIEEACNGEVFSGTYYGKERRYEHDPRVRGVERIRELEETVIDTLNLVEFERWDFFNSIYKLNNNNGHNFQYGGSIEYGKKKV